MAEKTIDQLTAEYTVWLAANGLPEMSADELTCEVRAALDGSSTIIAHITGDAAIAAAKAQIEWLSGFIAQWEHAENVEDVHAGYVVIDDINPAITWLAFVLANDLSDDEAGEIADDLADSGYHYGGGGAAPTFTIRRALRQEVPQT